MGLILVEKIAEKQRSVRCGTSLMLRTYGALTLLFSYFYQYVAPNGAIEAQLITLLNDIGRGYARPPCVQWRLVP